IFINMSKSQIADLLSPISNEIIICGHLGNKLPEGTTIPPLFSANFLESDVFNMNTNKFGMFEFSTSVNHIIDKEELERKYKTDESVTEIVIKVTNLSVGGKNNSVDITTLIPRNSHSNLFVDMVVPNGNLIHTQLLHNVYY